MFVPFIARDFPPAPEALQPRSPTSIGVAVNTPAYSSPFSSVDLEPERLETPFPIRQIAPRESPIDLPQEASFTEVTQTPWQQPKQQNSAFLAIAFLTLIIGACLWALKDDIFPALTADIPISSSNKNASLPSSNSVNSTPQTLKEPSLEPEPEIRRAEVVAPPIDLVAAGTASETLFKALLAAKSPEERLALIDAQEEHATDVAEFFAAGSPDLLSIKPSNATLRHLPSQEIAPMFQIITKQCPSGALLRVVQKNSGAFLLDWPLFAESHGQKLTKFIESKSTQPIWHHVCLRRDHGLELPEEEREFQVSFTLQGSLDAAGKCAAVAQKGSAIGRYLSRETEWGTIYVARLLLQHRTLKDGNLAVAILDCEGAAAGSTQ
ncbi:MAG: hypothetical protein NTV80_16470 [Verrucomicrobia bacterium]|nr:hypothetical protein [Verrucomicrobiota bacterium]